MKRKHLAVAGGLVAVGAFIGLVVVLALPYAAFTRLAPVSPTRDPVPVAAPVRYNAFPKLLRTDDASVDPNGSLLLTWYGGDRHVDSNSDGKVYGAHSTDGGRTWTTPAVLYDHPRWDCRNIGLVKAPNGTIVMFFAWVDARVAGYEWVDFGHVRSYDHGHSWTPFTSLMTGPANLSAHLNTPGNGYGDAVVVGSDLYVYCYGRNAGALSHTTYLLRSPDNGETWAWVSSVNAGTSIATNEADCWVLPDGTTIFGICRTAGAPAEGRLYYVESRDRGATWTTPRATSLVGQSPDLFRLTDGRYLLAYRTHDPWDNHYLGYTLLPASFANQTPTDADLQSYSTRCLVRTTFGQRGSDMAYPSIVTLTPADTPAPGTSSDPRVLVAYYDIAAGGIHVAAFAEASL